MHSIKLIQRVQILEKELEHLLNNEENPQQSFLIQKTFEFFQVLVSSQNPELYKHIFEAIETFQQKLLMKMSKQNYKLFLFVKNFVKLFKYQERLQLNHGVGSKLLQRISNIQKEIQLQLIGSKRIGLDFSFFQQKIIKDGQIYFQDISPPILLRIRISLSYVHSQLVAIVKKDSFNNQQEFLKNLQMILNEMKVITQVIIKIINLAIQCGTERFPELQIQYPFKFQQILNILINKQYDFNIEQAYQSILINTIESINVKEFIYIPQLQQDFFNDIQRASIDDSFISKVISTEIFIIYLYNNQLRKFLILKEKNLEQKNKKIENYLLQAKLIKNESFLDTKKAFMFLKKFLESFGNYQNLLYRRVLGIIKESYQPVSAVIEELEEENNPDSLKTSLKNSTEHSIKNTLYNKREKILEISLDNSFVQSTARKQNYQHSQRYQYDQSKDQKQKEKEFLSKSHQNLNSEQIQYTRPWQNSNLDINSLKNMQQISRAENQLQNAWKMVVAESQGFYSSRDSNQSRQTLSNNYQRPSISNRGWMTVFKNANNY